jgi:hypothetical protein
MNFAPMNGADDLKAAHSKLQTSLEPRLRVCSRARRAPALWLPACARGIAVALTACGRRELYTKAGEVCNLRQRLAAFEKELADERAKYHALLQGPAGRGAAGGAGASSREAARVRELEKEVNQVRTKLDFRENDFQKLSRWACPRAPCSAGRSRQIARGVTRPDPRLPACAVSFSCRCVPDRRDRVARAAQTGGGTGKDELREGSRHPAPSRSARRMLCPPTRTSAPAHSMLNAARAPARVRDDNLRLTLFPRCLPCCAKAMERELQQLRDKAQQQQQKQLERERELEAFRAREREQREKEIERGRGGGGGGGSRRGKEVGRGKWGGSARGKRPRNGKTVQVA